MKKLLQNRIAESSLTLPLTAVYALGVWLAAGLVTRQWWGQLACFAATSYLMVEMSNSNALLRVRSRMVSATFLVLSSMVCCTFGSLPGGIVQLCCAATLIILFHTYQDKASPGWVYYAFLCLGLGTTVFAPLFFFLPALWLLMATQLQSLSWRTWAASLLGVATPYWFGALWFIYQRDFTPLAAHFAQLGRWGTGADGQPLPYLTQLLSLTVSQTAALALTTVLTLTGMLHFWLRSYEDKIRIRLLYGFFAVLWLLAVAMLAAQPQHYDVLMRLVVVCGSPFIAHYFTLTHSRLTNIVFCTSVVLAVALMLFSLLIATVAPLQSLNPAWSGL